MEIYHEELEILRANVDPSSAELSTTSSMLGYCLFKLGQLSEAEPLLVDGYKVLSVTNGSDHTTTKEAAGRLPEFLSAQNQVDDFEVITQVQN